MAREEEKPDQQANDQPSQPQSPWEASKPGTHRKGQKTRTNTGLLFAPELGYCVV